MSRDDGSQSGGAQPKTVAEAFREMSLDDQPRILVHESEIDPWDPAEVIVAAVCAVLFIVATFVVVEVTGFNFNVIDAVRGTSPR